MCAEKADQALYLLRGNRYGGSNGGPRGGGNGGHRGGGRFGGNSGRGSFGGFGSSNFGGSFAGSRGGFSGGFSGGARGGKQFSGGFRGGRFGPPSRPFRSSDGSHPYKGPAPMDLGYAQGGNNRDVTCYQCGQKGHYKRDCPKLNKGKGDVSGSGNQALNVLSGFGNFGGGSNVDSANLGGDLQNILRLGLLAQQNQAKQKAAQAKNGASSSGGNGSGNGNGNGGAKN